MDAWMHGCMDAWMHDVCMYACMHVCIYLSIYLCMYVCMYVCIYVYLYMYIYIYAYMYTYTYHACLHVYIYISCMAQIGQIYTETLCSNMIISISLGRMIGGRARRNIWVNSSRALEHLVAPDVACLVTPAVSSPCSKTLFHCGRVAREVKVLQTET